MRNDLLVGVVPAPEGITLVQIDFDGALIHTPIHWLAVYRLAPRWSEIENRPIFNILYTPSKVPDIQWTNQYAHDNKKSGQCECGTVWCRTLGIDLGGYNFDEKVKQRLAFLQKREASNSKRREYARARKQRLATQEDK